MFAKTTPSSRTRCADIMNIKTIVIANRSRLNAIARRAAWPLAFLTVASLGCAASEEPKISEDLDVVPVTADDLGVPANSVAVPGEHHLDTSRTTGRFPSGLSVSRVVVAVDEPSSSRGLRPGDIEVDRAAYWNQVMDTLPPIREVTLLRQLGIDPRGAGCDEFLRESVRINCNLCLLYGQRDDENGERELIAVLWDAKGPRPLTAFRVPITPDQALLAKCKEDDVQQRVRIMNLAEANAEQELRTLVRNNIWDLVKLDGAVTTTQPSPWRTEDSLLPRDRDPLRRIEELLRGRPNRR